MSLKLYWNKLCPFVQRAWITAIEKKAPIELVYVSLENTPDWYKAINPRETVPALAVGDKLVFESLFIARYFDETFEPVNSLNPQTAETKYAINFFIDEAGNTVGSGYDVLHSGAGTDAQKELEAAVARLEKLLVKQSAGPFFLGTTFSLADIAIVPFLDRFSATLSAYHGVNIFNNAPRLEALYRAALLRPSVFQTSQPADYYVEVYKGYAKKEALPKPVPTFYYSPYCPYAHRAWIALKLKEVPFNPVLIDLKNIPATFEAEVNPRGTVPVLDLGNKNFVYESALIAEFAEDKYKNQGKSLAYADSITAANGRFFADDFGNAFGGFWAIVFGSSEEGKVEGRKNLQEGLSRIEKLLVANSAGPFAVGANITLADVNVIPFLVRYAAGQDVFQFPALSSFPRLNGLLQAALAIDAVKATVLPAEDYVAYWKKRSA